MSTTSAPAAAPAFGTVPATSMVVAEAVDGVFSEPRVTPVTEIALHPFSHALHYGSTGFEGLKAHRGTDGIVRLFRHDKHIARMRRTAELLSLPIPSPELLDEAIVSVVAANLPEVPEAPGSLYVRPLLLGTDPNIGAAAAPSADALLLVLASPVGDYFGGGRALSLLVECDLPRTTPQFGEVKAGANYVMALGVIRKAKADYGVDQVLFVQNGSVQETGAANVVLLDDERVVTPPLGSSFLHGVTRDSILRLAADLGYRVEERDVPLEELLAWQGEVALTGTAAVLSGVGKLVTKDTEVTVGTGEIGPNTVRLRDALGAIHRAEAPDPHGWLTEVVTTD